MEAFVASAPLSSAIALTEQTSLDGLLAALIYEESGDVLRAHADLPLKAIDGVWAASSILLEGPVIQGTRTIGITVRPTMLEPDLLERRKSGRYPAMDTSRGEFKNRQTKLTVYTARAVHFCGVGLVDVVAELLSRAQFLGKKRSSGYGEVGAEGWSVETLPCTQATSGFLFADGSPARPLPMELYSRLSDVSPPRSGFAVPAPPYFRGEPVLCALPVHFVGTPAHIHDLMGGAQ